jgi:peptidoglycan/LPS O-acetylase OafA/YrhL
LTEEPNSRSIELRPTANLLVSDVAKFKFRHFPELDGFRGLAVLLVLVGHSIQFSNNAPTGAGNALAQLGVMLFFVLSGFLITGVLYRERVETGGVNLLNFYARRTLRLAPALALFLGVVTLLIATKEITDVRWYELAVCLLYLRNIYGRSSSLAHLWSLSLEEQFYLLWPQVLKRIRLSRLLALTAGLTGLICVWRTLAIQLQWFDYNTGAFYLRPYFRFDSILIGCCISVAAAQSSGTLEQMVRISRRIPVAVAWLLLFVWTLWGESWSHSFYITLQMLGCALVLSQIVLDKPNILSTVFSGRAFSYVGRISYSLYLWQQLFLVVKYPNWGILRTFPMNVLLTFACAVASYHLIESPMLRWKRRFEPRTVDDAEHRRGQVALAENDSGKVVV